MASKQLIVAPEGQSYYTKHGGAGERPIIVFQNADADAIKQALTLWQEQPQAPPTKASLFLDAKFMECLADVVAYLESVQYVRRDHRLFDNSMVSNHFNNVMIEKFRDTEDGANEDDDKREFVFFVDEWFNDTRGKIPDAIANWDPKGYEPMPQWKGLTVDWYQKLVDMEKQYPGFVQLLQNCIMLEERMNATLAQRKATCNDMWPSEDRRTQMPEPKHTGAHFSGFTPSRMLDKGTPQWMPGGGGGARSGFGAGKKKGGGAFY